MNTDKFCFHHPSKQATAFCTQCHQPLCPECILNTPTGIFCSNKCVQLAQSPTTTKSEDYDATHIQILEGVQAVRKRPAMYIGDTANNGLHHLVYEVVDNSIDEAMAGYCTNITVKIHSDNSITVTDDGRGIPVDIHQEQNKPALEVIMTTLHAGGKFDRASYKISGGLHGVGLSVVNALSEKLEVQVYRNGRIYAQNYEYGEPQNSLQQLGPTAQLGTTIHFKPDQTIFSETTFNYETLAKRMRELSFLNRGIRISLIDDRQAKKETFYTEKGIPAFVASLNKNRNVLHADIIHILKETETNNGKICVEVALQYHSGYNETIYSYANNIHTKEGGSHLSGFKAALTRALNTYAKKENLLKGKISLTGEDLREGLTAVIAVKLPDPQFEGQTKTKLGNREIQSIVETIVHEQLSIYFEEHPQTVREIISKGIAAAHAREAARKARDLERQRKSPLSSGNLPGKLADCSSRDVDSTELYIVEGDSAGGSAKSGRDREFQAILPIKGKILNVEKARIDKILNHNEIKMIISAIGAGINNDFDINKRRYGKIIIMTDADIDGSHIRTLLLTFFFRQMRVLIEEGFIYIAQPPLYKFTRKRKERYIYTDKDFKNALLNFGMDGTTLRTIDGRICLSNENLKNTLNLLAQLEELNAQLQKQSISVMLLIKQRHPHTGKLPTCSAEVNGKTTYFYSQAELEAFVKSQNATNDQETSGFGENPSTSQPSIVITEYPETESLNHISIQLKKLGLAIEDYFQNEIPKFQVSDSKENYELCSLQEVLEKVREIGRQELDIQRYKGLGEMNPEQLWDTTMNPESRTLFQVKMEDAIEADQMFTTLMGSDVEPRKNFIEKHALEVKNLDI